MKSPLVYAKLTDRGSIFHDPSMNNDRPVTGDKIVLLRRNPKVDKAIKNGVLEAVADKDVPASVQDRYDSEGNLREAVTQPDRTRTAPALPEVETEDAKEQKSGTDNAPAQSKKK